MGLRNGEVVVWKNTDWKQHAQMKQGTQAIRKPCLSNDGTLNSPQAQAKIQSIFGMRNTCALTKFSYTSNHTLMLFAIWVLIRQDVACKRSRRWDSADLGCGFGQAAAFARRASPPCVDSRLSSKRQRYPHRGRRSQGACLDLSLSLSCAIIRTPLVVLPNKSMKIPVDRFRAYAIRPYISQHNTRISYHPFVLERRILKVALLS